MGLLKKNKKDTPPRLVLSFPGTSYEKVNETQAKIFDKIDGANFETNTEAARDMKANIKI